MIFDESFHNLTSADGSVLPLSDFDPFAKSLDLSLVLDQIADSVTPVPDQPHRHGSHKASHH